MRAISSRALVTAVLAVSGAALSSGPALAQIQQLPETSRSESQVNSLNGQIESQQQSRSYQQQNQFETNQIRGQIQSAPAPIVVTPPPIVGPRR
jgi:hypothetical protein